MLNLRGGAHNPNPGYPAHCYHRPRPAWLATLAAGALLALTNAGCTLFQAGTGVKPRRTPSQTSPAEPPQIVDHDTTGDANKAPQSPAAGEMSEIERWAARMQQPPVDSPVAAETSPAARASESDITYEPVGGYRYAAIEDVTGDPGEKTPPSPGPAKLSPTVEPPKTPPPPKTESAAAAPILRGVTAIPARSGAITNRPAAARGPAAANAGARAAGTGVPTFEQMVDRWLAQSPGGSFREQLDQRVLAVMAGHYDQARRPLQSVSREQQQMAARMVESLIAIRDAHGAQPQEEIDRVLHQLTQLREALVPLSDLTIPTLVVARSVRGFGNYTPFDPPEFTAGRTNEFVVYCELRNFVAVAGKDGGFESRFGMQTHILTPQGDVALEMNDDAIVDRCRSRRHDCFISSLVRLPATLSPGRYVVKVTIVDKIGHKVAQKRAAFRIVARS